MFTLKQEFYHINDDLLVKHLLGEASADEDKAVVHWINEDAANSDYYQQFKQIWDTSKQLAVESTVDENEAWERFQQRIEPTNIEQKKLYTNRFSWWKVAASVILLIALSLSGWLFFDSHPGVKELTAQSTLHVLVDSLPDGSVVTLNKRSSITYKEKFKGNTRDITLKGEAFFKVAPDKKKPFIITVNDVKVTVVGTSFNVKSENGNTEVVVETGIVKVTKKDSTVTLAAGERLLLPAVNGSLIKEAVTDHLYNYYRSKEFVCDDTPLWKLVEVLNKAYDVNIKIDRDALGQLKINTTFNNESLDKILEIIHLTFDIQITRQDGLIILQ